jgi:hypothetical protein
MGLLQRTLAQDEEEIRRLTLEVNELAVSAERANNRQAAAKKLTIGQGQ